MLGFCGIGLYFQRKLSLPEWQSDEASEGEEPRERSQSIRDEERKPRERSQPTDRSPILTPGESAKTPDSLFSVIFIGNPPRMGPKMS
jgi:hypothetical protein